MSEETPSIAAPEQNAIAETGSITAKTARGTIHCITIVGQIEGHMELPAQNKTTKYEHLIPQIAAVEQAEEDRRSAGSAQHGRRRCGSRTCHR